MRCPLQCPQDYCPRDSTRNIAPPRTIFRPPKSREILRKSPTSSQKCEPAKTAQSPPSTEESAQPSRLSPTPAAPSLPPVHVPEFRSLPPQLPRNWLSDT